jgi:beta-barrel assembly-enhancing protease
MESLKLNALVFQPKVIVGLSLVALSCLGLALYAEEQNGKSEVVDKALEDAKAEMEIGRNMAGKLLGFYGVFEDKPLIAYLNQVGNYVAKAGDFPNRRYMFSVLDSDSVNAFACPGGYILVTRGTIQHAKNEAELAAVLGHESAHVGLQHMYNSLKKMGDAEAKKMEEEAEARKLKDEYAVARLRPKAEESSTGSALAQFLLTANGGGMNLLQAAKAGINLMMEKGLDKKLEFEADKEGVKYAVRAGYDPKGLDQFLLRLAQIKKKEGEKSVMDKTHPSIPDRRKAIAETLNGMSADQITGAVLAKRFLGFQQRVLKKSKKSKSS